MKPAKIWRFLFLLSLVSLGLVIINPYNEIKIWGMRISLPQISFNTAANQPSYKDISRIIKLTAFVSDSTVKIDSIIHSSKTNSSLSADKAGAGFFNSDSLKEIIQPFEFPEQNDTVLFPFFRQLTSLTTSNQTIRILHYGDSQIEGDRITSYFRNQMQNKFGGRGIGLFPVVPVSPGSLSYVSEYSDNWQRHAIMSEHKDNWDIYGILGCFFKFETQSNKLQQDQSAWILLKYPNTSYKNASRFSRCKLLFSTNKSPVFIELKRKNTILDADIYPARQNFRLIDWPVDTGARDLLITLKAKDPPYVYALSLDDGHGVEVDNIPLRGSSGLEFIKLCKAPYAQMQNALNVKLIILQFGVNAVTTIAKNIDYYEKLFARQLKTLKAVNPQIPVIIIGVSDVSINSVKGYVTNPVVEKIRDIQKRVALTNGCVFWDLFTAMGGQNSMPSWVFASPSLAQKDFIHFSPLGAKLVGEMFYYSLISEYEKFQLLQQNKMLNALN